MELSHPYLWLCPCLMPPASFHSLPFCIDVGFMRPKMLGFSAAGVCMWWTALWLALYMFLKVEILQTKPGYPSAFFIQSVYLFFIVCQYLAVIKSKKLLNPFVCSISVYPSTFICSYGEILEWYRSSHLILDKQCEWAYFPKMPNSSFKFHNSNSNTKYNLQWDGDMRRDSLSVFLKSSAHWNNLALLTHPSILLLLILFTSPFLFSALK